MIKADNTVVLKGKNEVSKFNVKDFLMKYIMYIVLVLMSITLAVANDKFLTTGNMMTILKQISIQSIVAIGMTMIIISGNIDLSVGSVVAFCSVTGAMMMTSGVPIWLAVLLVVGIGGLLGFVSGGVTAKLKLHSFLVTLALMQAVRGLAQTITGGYPKAGLPEVFGAVAAKSIFGIPILVIYMIIFYAVFIYIMKYTAFGRSIYAIGSNEESARLSGINVEKVKTMVFVISSALCGVAGLLLTSKVRSGDPTSANGWEMDAIAGAIIGGTNMAGGEGKLGGTIIGLLFVGILANGMVLLGVNAYMQSVVKGLVIFLAVIINSIQKRSQN
ncbi:ABC transporter permease [Anaerobium acetethylicum]|uniref:Ribose transport system permease protein n=1 Tax=Anaerobium acetethylicum TaxID=1619234 RepID=A0A1D3TYT1_9FIRM|nr:ABC transporter permease [Anaerobium acetethylicum]SCP99651.1 ribose transport system permease protein [Anaerobium acetethylicum]